MVFVPRLSRLNLILATFDPSSKLGKPASGHRAGGGLISSWRVDARFPVRQLGCRLQLPLSEPATLLNVVLVAVPTAVIATRQTTTMSASMTAYSTAVGPASDLKNRQTRFAKVVI
jgi:hypothetical protein